METFMDNGNSCLQGMGQQKAGAYRAEGETEGRKKGSDWRKRLFFGVIYIFLRKL